MKVTLDPAMLMYLDLEDSDKAKPNENYAREFFELFTLGIGHYTEQDIKATARALTGWTLAGPRGTGQGRATAADTPRDFARDGLVATFVPERRDDGSKTILGETGHFELDDVVALVSRQDALARFLAAKLTDYFGAVDPRGELQARMATAFQDSRGEISRGSPRSLHRTRVLLRSLARLAHQEPDSTPRRRLPPARSGRHGDPKPGPAHSRDGSRIVQSPQRERLARGRTWIGAGTLAVRYHLATALLDSKEPAGLEPVGFNRFLAVPRDTTQGAAMIARLEGAMAERSSEPQEGRPQVPVPGRCPVSARPPRIRPP